MRSFANRKIQDQGSSIASNDATHLNDPTNRIGSRLVVGVIGVIGAAFAIGCATNKSEDSNDGGLLTIDDGGVKDTGHTTFDSSPEPVIDAGEDAATTSGDASSDDASTLSDASDADDGAPLIDSCTPTPLACDGIDHNCSGTVDQGCPTAVTIGLPATDGLLWGNPSGGTAFTDSCPAGQVLIGMSGYVGTSIDAVGGLCGIASLNENTATNPYTYSISIVPGSLLPSHGSTGSSAFTRQCPANQALVKVSGQSGLLIDGFILSCAPLVVSGTIGSFTVSQGTTTTDLNFVGGTGGTPFTPFTCPSTQFARTIGGRSGNSLDALSISCATPALTLR